jgi:hypothetical protein
MFRGQGGSGNPLNAVAPLMHGPVVLPGCGHWTQQERPAEVNAALIDFLTRIAARDHAEIALEHAAPVVY